MHNNEALLQLIKAVCMSASDLRLNFGSKESQPVLESQPGLDWQPIMQLFQSLSCSKALSSLQLSFCGYPEHALDIDSVLGTLSGLKDLTLAFNLPPNSINFIGFLPGQRFFMNLFHLTFLCLGPGFHFLD
jgi:hypothetical protein